LAIFRAGLWISLVKLAVINVTKNINKRQDETPREKAIIQNGLIIGMIGIRNSDVGIKVKKLIK